MFLSKLHKTKTKTLRSIKNFFNLRTFLNYFIILLVLTPCTFSDKLFNRSHNLQKRRYQDDIPDYPEPTSQSVRCSSCMMREQIKQRNLEVIKGEILRRMGFSQAPNITGKVLPHIPPHFLAMVEDYGMQSDQPSQKVEVISEEDEEDEYHIKTQKVVTFAQPYPRLRHKGRDILHFTFGESVTKFHVSNATLYVFIRGSDRRPLPEVFLEVFKVKKITEHNEPPSVQRVYARKFTQSLGKGDWLRIDFSETVSEWFKNPGGNHGFIVNATANGKKVVVTDVNADKGRKTPYVDISIMEPKKRNRRNTILNCDEKSDQPICCRYPLMVDFEQIGFDFIIAPKRYNAYMCAGDCSYLTLQKYAHTHLTQMTQQNTLPPCCTPRKMNGINMLYFDMQTNIVYGSLPGMVVERCGCL